MPVASPEPIPTRPTFPTDRANDRPPDVTPTIQVSAPVVIPVVLVGVVYVMTALLLGWWAQRRGGFGDDQGPLPSLVLAGIVVALAAALGRSALGVVSPSSLARGCLAVGIMPAARAVNSLTDAPASWPSICSSVLVLAVLGVLIGTSASALVVKVWTSATVIACAMASYFVVYDMRQQFFGDSRTLYWRGVLPFGLLPGGLGPFATTSVVLVVLSAAAACAAVAAVWSGSVRRVRPVAALDPSWATSPGAFAAAGYPTAAPYGPTNSMAIVALVLGLTACLSPLGLVFGLVALSQLRASGGRQQGRGMAIAGVVLGAVGVLLWVVYLVLVIALGTAGTTTSG